MISVLLDAMASLKNWGFRRVFFINHHMDGRHSKALDKAIQKARMEIGIEAYWIIDRFFLKPLGFKGSEPHLLIHKNVLPFVPTSPYLNIHAEGYETSFMWSCFPELVDLQIWKTLKPTNLTVDDLLVWQKGGAEARKVTPLGYFGDPTTASPERGREEIQAYGRTVAGVIEAFLQGHDSPPK
jgi:creatinine amidohydrolase